MTRKWVEEWVFQAFTRHFDKISTLSWRCHNMSYSVITRKQSGKKWRQFECLEEPNRLPRPSSINPICIIDPNKRSLSNPASHVGCLKFPMCRAFLSEKPPSGALSVVYQPSASRYQTGRRSWVESPRVCPRSRSWRIRALVSPWGVCVVFMSWFSWSANVTSENTVFPSEKRDGARLTARPFPLTTAW